MVSLHGLLFQLFKYKLKSPIAFSCVASDYLSSGNLWWPKSCVFAKPTIITGERWHQRLEFSVCPQTVHIFLGLNAVCVYDTASLRGSLVFTALAMIS